MSKKPRILILSAGAGQGHNQAARALEAAVRGILPEAEVKMLDSLDYTTESFKTIYSRYYIETVKNTPTLWGWAFEWTDVPWKNQNLREWFERINAQPLVKKILGFKPDFVINTHFVPAAVTSYLIRRGKLSAHHSIVVTDFYAHATWLVRKFHRYFVAHEEERQQLVSYNIPSERISVSGIPVAPEFSSKPDKKAIRTHLGLKPDLPVVLLAAGAYGVVPVHSILEPLLRISRECQLVVLCGKNSKLQDTVRSFIHEKNISNPHFTVLGYTDEIHTWMSAADLFITKPGGLTTAESLAIGLPLMLTDPIPGQEVSNAMYLLEHGAAVMPTSPATVGYKVEKFLTNPDYRDRIKKAAVNLGRPKAAEEIIRTLLSHRKEDIISLAFPGDE